MSAHVEVISQLAKRVAKLDIDWYGAASYAVAHKGLVDVDALLSAKAALGDEVAAAIYGATHSMAQLEASQPEEIDMSDVTVINDLSDNEKTEDGIVVYVTVNQLIMRLAALRDADADVGMMRVMVAAPGSRPADLRSVDVESLRRSPIDDGDYALVLR